MYILTYTHYRVNHYYALLPLSLKCFAHNFTGDAEVGGLSILLKI